MGHASALVTFQGLSGLSKDRFENTFHFITDTEGSVSAGDAVAIAGRLQNFYEGVTGGGNALFNFMSPILEATAQVKVYDADTTPTGPPVLTASFPHGSGGASMGLPEEIALCLSYNTGVNSPKHRGRIYIGPLSVQGMGAGTGSPSELKETRPTAGLLGSLQDAGTRLKATGDGVIGASFLAGLVFGIGYAPTTTGVSDCNWALFSRIGTGTKAAPAPTWALVNAGWIDNEWDGQSRRRTGATARVAF